MNNEKDMIMIYTVIASNLYPILWQFKNASVLKSRVKQCKALVLLPENIDISPLCH